MLLLRFPAHWTSYVICVDMSFDKMKLKRIIYDKIIIQQKIQVNRVQHISK